MVNKTAKKKVRKKPTSSQLTTKKNPPLATKPIPLTNLDRLWANTKNYQEQFCI